jgi:hypothetical protein
MAPAGSGAGASGVVVAVVSSPLGGVVAGAGACAVEAAGAVTVFVPVRSSWWWRRRRPRGPHARG